MSDTANLKIIFGKNVKYYRLQRKLSQEKFCELIGISVGFLSHIEMGIEAPSFETISKICHVLGIEAMLLFDKSVISKKIPNRITECNPTLL